MTTPPSHDAPVLAPAAAITPARYRRAFHTRDVELGRLAAVAKPKLLVL